MQKICIHLALQLFIENHPESNSTADDDSLLLTTAERAAEGNGLQLSHNLHTVPGGNHFNGE